MLLLIRKAVTRAVAQAELPVVRRAVGRVLLAIRCSTVVCADAENGRAASTPHRQRREGDSGHQVAGALGAKPEKPTKSN